MSEKIYRDQETVKKLVQWISVGHQTMAELVDELYGCIDELQQKVTDLTACRDELEQRETEKEEIVNALKRDLEQSNALVEQLRQQETADDAVLEQECAVAVPEAASEEEPEDRIRQLEHEIETLSAENDRLNQELSQQRLTMSELKQKLDDQIAGREQLQREKDEVSQTLEQAKQTLVQVCARRNELEARLQEQTQKNNAASSEGYCQNNPVVEQPNTANDPTQEVETVREGADSPNRAPRAWLFRDCFKRKS